MEIKLRVVGLQKLPQALATPQGQQQAIQVQATVDVEGFPQQNVNPAVTFLVPAPIGDKFHIDEIFVAHLSHRPETAS